MRRFTAPDVRALKLLATSLTGSLAASVIALGVLLEPSTPDWLAKTAGAWFGGGLAALLLTARGTQRRAAVVGFLVALAWNTAVLSPLYRGEGMMPFHAGLSAWVTGMLGRAVAYKLVFLLDRSVTMSSVVAFVVAPHIAATSALALIGANVVPWQAGAGTERCVSRKGTRPRLLRIGLLLALVSWGSFHMPSNVFGVSGGSAFCRTMSACEKNYCGDHCYGLAPLKQTDFIERCADSRVHCECRYAQCETIPVR